MNILTFLAFGLLLLFPSLHACTAFHIKANDGAQIYCRSMEFGFPLDSDLLIVPRGSPFTGTAPNGKPGIKWKATFGYVGMNQNLARHLVSDGMNEKGLVVGVLYLPEYTHYQPFDAARQQETLGGWELASYLLGNCATTEDVKATLPKLLVAEEGVPSVGGFKLPLHYLISDASGTALVVEYVNGTCMMHDNSIGTLTNAPPFDWHVTNLSNFVNLTPLNVPKLKLSAFDIDNVSQGTGLLGLPGDYTPPSRFVRATLFSYWATTPATALEGVRTGFHILNTFDIFEGIVKEHAKMVPMKTKQADLTEWVIVHDKTNLKTYFRGYKSLMIQMADLKKIDFSKPGLMTIGMNRSFTFSDETKNAVLMK